ncbi:branched-chain amino acid ABC transporter permease [Mesorhizobium sp. CO1-1-8]|uniref:branched-chain amino acid ABC transporter permease n=1 Tax=Mesorhizobium sp. CO1-1-8 TaxID=2876631 RepID=UPI001CD08F74|nr:branched-chain amino acid ABC transporter permease [Mesorhizobium sp. CO1-1-8]MBZ9772549.1 branched-chain amino acid ABC transporter permease [Mesorhizobium sp. CO1-1-8]
MSLTIVLLIQIVAAIATLALFSAGLAIVFGMMRVINLAHGEFLMLGAYSAIKSHEAGINDWIGMIVVAPIVVGLVGIIVERVLISRLYGRLIETMLATWGLSLFLTGLVTTIFGNTTLGTPTPLGTITIGDYGLGAYSILLIGVCALLMAAIYAVLRLTPWGIIARGTMQNPDMVAALGYNPKHIYAATFAIGAAVSGLAGGLLAPLTGVIPTMGSAFVAKAFITVISGGEAIILGTGSASIIFGGVNQLVSYWSTAVLGEAALLLAAIMLLRVLPQGISGRFFKGGV